MLHLRDVAGRRSAELELERLAYTDYLTGLPNRARLMAALATARARVAGGGTPACLLLLDLDGFKPVNDVAGHEAGDHLLVQVAARLRATVRDGDLVGRLGGDEFAVLVADGAGRGDGARRADRRRARGRCAPRTARPRADASGVVLDVSGSVGVTELDPADDVSTTIRQADLALRAAKAAGKSCVRTAGHAIDSAAGRRARLARDLPAALEQEQFRVVYQPVVGRGRAADPGAGGAGPLGPPGARHRAARRVHLPGRGRRPDRDPAALGAAARHHRRRRAAGRRAGTCRWG